MPIAVAVIADDLTGAADTAVGFRRAGLSATVAWIESIGVLLAAQSADVVAIDTRTRSRDADHARNATATVVREIRRAAVPILYTKIDSGLRGHVGEDVRAAIEAWHPGAVAIVAPAFPGAGRVTLDGIQRAADIPLEYGSVPAVLQAAGLRTRTVALATVRSGSLARMCEQAVADGVHAIVCDAECDEDLHRIALAGPELGPRVVWVGSGGLARAMGPLLRPTETVEPATDRHIAAGPILVVVGSTSEIARRQAAHLASRGMAEVIVPAPALQHGAIDVAGRIRGDIEACLRTGDDVLVRVAGDGGERSEDHRLVATLGEWLQPVAPLVGGAVLTGGETAVSVLRAWQTTALDLIAEIEPGVPLASSIAPVPIPVVTKSGAFGDPETLERACVTMRRRA